MERALGGSNKNSKIKIINMKRIAILCAMILCGCGEYPTSVEQLQKVKKPAIVYAEHSDYPNRILIIQDADGKLITIENDNLLPALLDKYNIGDTIQN